MKIAIVVLVFLFVFFDSFTQEKIITCLLFDEKTKKPVESAFIYDNYVLAAISDVNGVFKVEKINYDTCKLLIRGFPCFKDTIIDIPIVEKYTKIEIGLKKIDIVLVDNCFQDLCPICKQANFNIPVKFGLKTHQNLLEQNHEKYFLIGLNLKKYKWYCKKCHVVY